VLAGLVLASHAVWDVVHYRRKSDGAPITG